MCVCVCVDPDFSPVESVKDVTLASCCELPDCLLSLVTIYNLGLLQVCVCVDPMSASVHVRYDCLLLRLAFLGVLMVEAFGQMVCWGWRMPLKPVPH